LRLVVIGDVGVLDGMVHIGDEAMFEALVLELRSRGFDDITGVSANPVETAARYGIEAVAGIGFGGPIAQDRAAQSERMTRVLRVAAGDTAALDPGDSAFAVIDSIRSADGVAISGGGNMASNWPLHIFERATIGAIAALYGIPLVVSGQTIGPPLSETDAALVATLLGSAKLVGLREGGSFDLVGRLGVDPGLLTATVDDASFLPAVASPSDRPYCAVTLSSHVGDADRDVFYDAVALLLDQVAATTGLEIVFFAHFASLDPTEVRGDSVVHAAVGARMTAPFRVIPTTDARHAAGIAKNAALVVSSRYHPAVFAVSAGVPTIGITVDEYTSVKLTGALGNFAQHSVISAAEVIAGGGQSLVSTVWSGRDDVRGRGLEAAARARAASVTWWDRVAAALG
jgi:polysaccharide pyruvyl transferase WcaK-like protein